MSGGDTEQFLGFQHCAAAIRRVAVRADLIGVALRHGRAADLCVAETGSGVMKATDIVAFIRKTVAEIEGSRG